MRRPPRCSAITPRPTNWSLTTVRAKEAVEALLRVLLLKVPASTVRSGVFGVLNQRLIRQTL